MVGRKFETVENRIIEVDDYEPEKPSPIIKKTNSISYRPLSKFSEIKSGDTYVQASYTLDSEEDFPSL